MDYEELVRDHAGEMIEKLVTDVVTKEKAEIHFEDAGDDQWSVVRMHIYEEDKEIALRLHANDVFELYFGYYDDKDEFFEIIRKLTPEEKNVIPKGLQKIMLKVLKDEEGLRVPGNLLTRNA